MDSNSIVAYVNNPFGVEMHLDTNTFRFINANCNPDITNHKEGVRLLADLSIIVEKEMDCINLENLSKKKIFQIIKDKAELIISDVSRLSTTEKLKAFFICPDYEIKMTASHKYIKFKACSKMEFNLIPQEIIWSIAEKLDYKIAFNLIRTSKATYSSCKALFTKKHQNEINKDIIEAKRRDPYSYIYPANYEMIWKLPYI